MNWFERNHHWVLLTLAVVMGYALVGFLGVSMVALLAGAAGGASIGALLADAAIVLGITATMIVAELVLVAGFVASVVRRLSFPTNDRLARLFAGLEALVPAFRDLALSQRFQPTLEEREQEIKRRYVEGELSEWEFEREIADLLAEAEPEPAPVDHADSLGSVGSTGEREEWIGDSLARDVVRSEKHREPDRE